MIQMIDINKLHHHPDNPRKDLGDLTELAESIKERGVLQNLTLVPIEGKEDEYYAVIGNRRLAASKLAGLTEVPASISEMDYKTQIGTMLLENIQREDLTVYEQAQGFQMMMDLGETVRDISQKTGFSETTIRHRTKLLELDQDKFKESVERGATLMDYVELEKIKDVKLKNKVLEKIGTSNFKWELSNALSQEREAERKEILISTLKKFATQVEDTGNMQYLRAIYVFENLNEKDIIPDDADTTEYFYKIFGGGTIYLYKKADDQKEVNDNSEWEEKQRLRNEKRDALDEISNRAFMLRYDFAKDITSSVIKRNSGAIVEILICRVLDDGYYTLPNQENYADFFNIKLVEEDNNEDIDEYEIYKMNFKIIRDHIKIHPEISLFVLTYLMLDSKSEKYYDRDNKYRENESLDKTYELLESFGYEMSDEEKSLQNGTHELFQK